MSKDNKQMTFQEWMNQINSANANISIYNDGFNCPTYLELSKEDRKALCYRNTYARLYNLTMKLFKWKVPEGMDARAIEMGFITRGQVCLFKIKEGTFILPCIPQNRYNVYGNPTQVYVMGYNGFCKVMDIEYESDIPTNIGIPLGSAEGVGIYCRDNDLTYPYIYYIKEYADKIADKLIALNVATQRLKSPFRAAVSDMALKDTVEDYIDKIESNDDTIIVLKNKKLQDYSLRDSIASLNDNHVDPNIIKAIKEAILFDFNQFLELLGINTNPTPDKSQVVLTPELESNDELISLEAKTRFDNRIKFCEDAKKFGVTLSVELQTDLIKKEANKFRMEVQNGFGNEAGQPSKGPVDGSQKD